ncbi:MAG: hypothetical protein ACE5EV_04720 [Gaiellales bacterium]
MALIRSLRPRAVHDRRLPVLLSGSIVLLLFPVVFFTSLPTAGWLAGAGLWAVSQLVGGLLALVFGRTSLASGAVAVGLSTRGVLIAFALAGLAAIDPSLGLAALIVYATSYGVELTFTLALYF